jgi:zinc transporter 2
MRKLFFVGVICFVFMILEFIGGIWSGSLAILTDASHMFSDVAGFMISFISIYISQKEATFSYSYGYHRAEIIGALGSIYLIWGLLIWLNCEATRRIINPPEKIDANVMLITAIIGLCCNLVNLCALDHHDHDDETAGHDNGLVEQQQNGEIGYDSSELFLKVPDAVYNGSAKSGSSTQNTENTSSDEANKLPLDVEVSGFKPTADKNQLHQGGQREGGDLKLDKQTSSEKNKSENMNMRAAAIHILGDMVQSIGVIAAAIIIKLRPDWQIADPICTYLFSILVLMTTIPIFRDCMRIIMEATPTDIPVADLYNSILKLETVEEIIDFHCWSLAGGKYVMSCHVRSNYHDEVVTAIDNLCKSPQWGIYHTTI